MPQPSLFDLIRNHISWIVGFFSLGMGVASVLIMIGMMREKISRAAIDAQRLRRELYKEDGTSVYVPRYEYNLEIVENKEKMVGLRHDFMEYCAQCRTGCQGMISDKIDDQRQDIKDLRNKIMALYRFGFGQIIIKDDEDYEHETERLVK